MTIPSPNIWHWPEWYEVENRAQDVDGAIFRHLRAAVDWTAGTVADVGCGSGFHLPVFAESAATVYGVEPHIFPGMGHNMMLEPGWRSVAERIADWFAAHRF